MERSKNTNVFQRNKHNIILLLLTMTVATAIARTGGGLVGANFGTIENSYSAGLIVGSAPNIGGLVGSNSGTVTNSFYNSQTGGRTDNDGRGVPLATTQMRQQSYFTNWNFTTIWGINANINDGMPHLRMFRGECPHTWSGWITTSAPTCETDGVATRNCTDCGEAEIQPIAKLGHNWDDWGNWTTTIAPTCDGDGIRIRIAECRRMSCETDTTQIGTIPQLTDCPTSIRGRQEAISPYRILLENAVVSDFARISVITPEQATVNLAIFDNLGNVVFSANDVRAGWETVSPLRIKPAPTNADDNAIIWDLTNQSGRFVANGTYLIVVEATGVSGRRFTYSTRIGVNR
jgi:hypothetical protein